MPAFHEARRAQPAPSGAVTNITIELPVRSFLMGAALSLASGDPAVRAAIDVFPSGPRKGSATIQSGWIRGHTNFPGSGGLRWDGDIPLTKEEPQVRATVRNDTGSEVSVTFHIEAEYGRK